jgi:PhnB protein
VATIPKKAIRKKKRVSSHAPRGWHTITPRLFAEDARALVTFVKRVFGGTGTYQAERPSEIRIGDSIVMITEAGIRPPTPAFLYVYVADADATYRKAIKAGARSIEEPTDMPYGDRRAMVDDRWGNTWQIATHLEGRSQARPSASRRTVRLRRSS